MAINWADIFKKTIPDVLSSILGQRSTTGGTTGGGNLLGTGGSSFLPMLLAGSSKPHPLMEDLARTSLAGAGEELDFYRKSLLPARENLLGTYGQRMGRTEFPGETPELLTEARGQTLGRLKEPLDVTEPFQALRKNLLGEFDIGFERLVQDPMQERLIQQGLYSSGPGYEMLRRSGQEAARERSLLGSQVDVDMLKMAETARADELARAERLGTTEFDINQLLGFTQPLEALKTAAGMEAPTFGVSLPAVQEDVPWEKLLLGTAAENIIPTLLERIFGGGAKGEAGGVEGALGTAGTEATSKIISDLILGDKAGIPGIPGEGTYPGGYYGGSVPSISGAGGAGGTDLATKLASTIAATGGATAGAPTVTGALGGGADLGSKIFGTDLLLGGSPTIPGLAAPTAAAPTMAAPTAAAPTATTPGAGGVLGPMGAAAVPLAIAAALVSFLVKKKKGRYDKPADLLIKEQQAYYPELANLDLPWGEDTGEWKGSFDAMAEWIRVAKIKGDNYLDKMTEKMPEYWKEDQGEFAKFMRADIGLERISAEEYMKLRDKFLPGTGYIPLHGEKDWWTTLHGGEGIKLIEASGGTHAAISHPRSRTPGATV